MLLVTSFFQDISGGAAQFGRPNWGGHTAISSPYHQNPKIKAIGFDGKKCATCYLLGCNMVQAREYHHPILGLLFRVFFSISQSSDQVYVCLASPNKGVWFREILFRSVLGYHQLTRNMLEYECYYIYICYTALSFVL